MSELLSNAGSTEWKLGGTQSKERGKERESERDFVVGFRSNTEGTQGRN